MLLRTQSNQESRKGFLVDSNYDEIGRKLPIAFRFTDFASPPPPRFRFQISGLSLLRMKEGIQKPIDLVIE